jgi:hypothetical protein
MYKALTILLVFASHFSWGQDDNVVFSIEPRSADVGETVLITIKTKVQGEVEIDNLPSCFVQGYQTVSGMDSQMDPYTGKLITYYYFSQTGAFGKEGKYTVGPVYVKKGNKTYKSNTLVITIGDNTPMTSGDVTARQLRDDAFGLIQTNKTTIYEGEPILVSAKVYARFKPNNLDSYLPYSMKGAIDQHPLSNVNYFPPAKLVQFRGRDLVTFDYNKSIIFPVGVGKFKINPFRMRVYNNYQSFLLTSSSASVTIKPLPPDPPSDFIGGVGNFSVERIVEEGNFKQGEVFKMKIIISGVGNLQNIIEPTPALPKGFIVYGDPQIEENFSYTFEGAEGSISYEYNIQVSKHGDLLLPATTISYFDVNQEQYVSSSTEESTVKVKKNENFIAHEVETQDTKNLEELDVLGDLRKSNLKENKDTLFGSPLFWAGLGSPLMAALLFILFTKRREQSEEKIVVRKTIHRKDREISENIAQLKVLLAAGDTSALCSKIEATLKKAFELEMKLGEDYLLNRQDIFDHLEKTNRTNLSSSVNTLLSKCDQYRFGLAADNASNQALFNELESILNELKS